MATLIAEELEQAGFIQRHLGTKKINRLITGLQTLIAFGDSFTHNGATHRNSSTDTYVTKTVGYWVWINMLSNSTLKVLDHAGTSGNKVSDMLARIDDVLLSDATIVVVLAGTNDIAADVSVNEISTNMLSLVNQITANNQYVILCPVAYRSGGINDQIDLLNAEYVKIAAGNNKCFIVDDYTTFNAAVTAENYDDVTLDNLHPNTRGAYLIGENIAKAVDDHFDSGCGDIMNLAPNPEFEGNDGAVIYGGTGEMPTSWTVQYPDPTDGGTGSGTGVGASVSDGVISFRTGAESPTTQARVLCPNVTVEPNETYIFDAIVSIENSEDISTFSIAFNTQDSNAGTAKFQFQPPAGVTTQREIRISTPPINVGNSTYIKPSIQGYGSNLNWTLRSPRIFKI